RLPLCSPRPPLRVPLFPYTTLFRSTPIPRTLGMSLEGIRDFSVIATAPQKRLAIKTFVRREDKSTIREALLRELKRGGQAYFLRSEEHTSELQSRENLVCRLLLEKK